MQIYRYNISEISKNDEKETNMIVKCIPDANCVVKEFDGYNIKYAFHDIDGTHSLIRDWPPVMSAVLNDVIVNGLPTDFDSPNNLKRLIDLCGKQSNKETDDFCIESAGLSALTQMEWAIRRAAEEGTVKVAFDREDNRRKIDEIYGGREIFATPDSPELEKLLTDFTPRLFKFYEAVLNGYCRDRNLKLAYEDPERFRIPGSLDFLKYLKAKGVKNYFVTGAVVEKGMGMFEEAKALGFIDCPDAPVEDIVGSTWTDKVPKNIIMERLMKSLNASGSEILVVGDGRSEISAGVGMGALTVSRLPQNAEKQRELHKKLGTDIIISDYNDFGFKIMFGEAI